MPTKIPKICLHKPSGRAYVTLNGQQILLGRFGTKEADRAYRTVIAEWLSTGSSPKDDPSNFTIVEIMARYLKHCRQYYRKNGKPTSEVSRIKSACKPLRAAYGKTLASEFGPKRLKVVRDTFVKRGLHRKTVNEQVRRLKQMFRWATENELVQPMVWHGLQSVAGLKKGRTRAPESTGVRPVDEGFIDAVLPFVSAEVRSMIQIQKLTGMRPGEVVIMRTIDIEREGKVWIYRPTHHKTEHHGIEREIAIGPKAQAVLAPWLRVDPEAYLFDPRQAAATKAIEKRLNRETPLWPSHVAAIERNRVRNRRRPPSRHYSTGSYRRAIARACELAKVPLWSPNQLRHNAATSLRKEFGIEAARVILGHRSAITSEIYAEIDRTKSIDIMGVVG